jgi:prolyl-tRNA synthetase
VFKGYRGIEVGHVFFLGKKYSKPMGVNFLAADGHEKPAEMGCYGIGVTRIVAAAIEQNHDKDGIVWPLPLAPYEVAVLELQKDDDKLVATATKIYEDLKAAGVDVLYDDRDERPGVKFKDADLIGIPYRIAVGKKGLAEGVVELKLRRGTEVRKVKIDEIVPLVVAEVAKERT